MREIAEGIADAIGRGGDTVLVTVVQGRGSTPRHGGSQMLIDAKGLACGTIGGGAVEAHGIETALALLGQRKARVEDLGLRKDLGMACGGGATLLYTPICANDEEWRAVALELLRCNHERIDVCLVLRCVMGEELFEGGVALFDASGALLAGHGRIDADSLGSLCEPHNAGSWFVMPVCLPVRAVVFGGGHVGRATVEALSRVGFACTLYDNRPEFAVPERFPSAQEVICGSYQDIAASFAFDKRDFVLIMTSGHESDFAVLGQALRQPLAYVGMMGSRRKIATGRSRMLQAGISEEAFDAVHAPIGLEIKAETPEEIAVSIAAECILCRAEG